MTCYDDRRTAIGGHEARWILDPYHPPIHLRRPNLWPKRSRRSIDHKVRIVEAGARYLQRTHLDRSAYGIARSVMWNPLAEEDKVEVPSFSFYR